MANENSSQNEPNHVDPKGVTKPMSPDALDPAFKPTDRLSNLPDDFSEKVTAPLSSMPAPASKGDPYISISQQSDVGVVRTRNEDSCFSFIGQSGGSSPLIPFALGIVADGMGGHMDGHEASRKVADNIASYVLERVYMPLLKGRPAEKPLQEIMEEAVNVANQAIYSPDPEKEGGTTATGALIVGRRLYLIHVGDTRAYLIYDDKFEQLTTDHSIVKRLEESGQITAEQAAQHPHRNLLYRAITGHDLEVDTYTRSLPKFGHLFICSDGLWDYVSASDIQLVILNDNLSIQERCEKLVELALSNGSTDNVTGMLFEFRVG